MLHGVITRKTALFIDHAVRNSKLMQPKSSQRTAKHIRLRQLVLPNAQPAAAVWMLHSDPLCRGAPLVSVIGDAIPICEGNLHLACMRILLQHCTMFRFSADISLNLQEPCVPYIGRAQNYPLDAPFYIFIQQISVLNILNMLYNVHFFPFKMPFIS